MNQNYSNESDIIFSHADAGVNFLRWGEVTNARATPTRPTQAEVCSQVVVFIYIHFHLFVWLQIRRIRFSADTGKNIHTFVSKRYYPCPAVCDRPRNNAP